MQHSKSARHAAAAACEFVCANVVRRDLLVTAQQTPRAHHMCVICVTQFAARFVLYMSIWHDGAICHMYSVNKCKYSKGSCSWCNSAGFHNLCHTLRWFVRPPKTLSSSTYSVKCIVQHHTPPTNNLLHHPLPKLCGAIIVRVTCTHTQTHHACNIGLWRSVAHPGP